ncbi:MAG: carboxypeptidase regulatory-like domain-containing protein [Candidatus Diapherotrites archaeon]|nr:carboxypeptidase regulatory-like domain-containing protein [Candidatus Diapherotrites archaeon]
MGFLDSVKDIYFQAEDKYYQFLDKIDEKIPVYKIIDPIDSIVPSFAVLLLAAFLAILLGIGAIASILFTPTTSTLSVTVLDSGGEPIEGAMVKFIVLGEEKKIQQTGADGTAFLENLAKELEVVVEASKENFLTKTQTITITELPQQLLQITLEEEGAAVLSKTIRIVDAHGAALSKYFTLSFRCTSPYAVPPADVELSPRDNGVARVLAPTNCETLLVSVTNDADFEPVASFEVFAEQTDVKIEMEETERETGTIAVILKTGGEIVSQPVEVQLYRYEELLANPEIGPIDTDISSGGEAGFGVSAGNYVVKSVATSSLGAATSPRISVQAGETKEVTLELSKTVVGEIKIKVVDSDSDEPVDDAKVTLKFQSDDRVLAAKETDKDEDSIVGFSISADVAYRVVVEAEGFQLAKRESLRISDAIVTIGLEKCTPSTCGELRVKVIDQDGEPVENATVALYNADTDFLAGFSTKTSDANGEAEFGGVHSGNYFAFAFKESVSGRSDPAFFSSSAPKKEETHLTVTMVVPNGLIKATIADKDNRPIPFAFVGLYDDRTEELLGSAIGDANGSFSFETKADKKVYLKIRKKDSTPKYADYVTAAKPVIAGTVQQFNVTLEPEIIDKDIEIEFLGLFSADGKTATVLSKGEEFVAKLRLLVPEEKDYRETGVHLRTGTELIMEKDALFVKKVNAPATSQIRATKFDEKSGLEETQYDFTNSEAKWVNLVWSNPDAGIYEIEAVVAVKETASISNELKIFWRAWALDGARERHPQDDTITKELYSEAFSRIYEIGVTTLCDDEFCFSARIRDIEEGLIEPVVDTYNARMVKEYELKFTILNNSTFRIHDLANLRIANEDETLVFKEYQIIDAQTRPTSGTLNGSEFPRFEVGKLEPKNKKT